jgi:hypothetical protein
MEARGRMKDLFGNEKAWKEHWVDMPEFVQESQKPFSQIIIRFETEQDLNDFSALIGQKLTPKTKSIWHPFKSHWGKPKKVWTDES